MLIVTAASAAAAVDLCMAIIALQIFPFLVLAPQLGPGAADPASAQAPLLDSAVVELLLPLAALLTAVTVIYHNLHDTPADAGEGAAAGNNRRLWVWEAFAVLCVSAGTLHLFFFVQPNKPAGVIGGGDVGAQARALGLAAARVLPAAAAMPFFLGMALIIVGHIRAGGEGGGGGGAFAADGGQQIQGPVLFLTKAAYAAAAALAGLMVMALCACGGGTAIY